MIEIECSFKSESVIGRALSNLTPRPFIFMGYEFTSVEGFLQSLKTSDDVQAGYLRSLYGFKAWKEGQAYNDLWRSRQRLFFNGVAYNRTDPEYASLITSMYDAVYDQSVTFRRALYDSKHAILVHNGFYDTSLSVLTVPEYLMNLYRLRTRPLEA